MFKLFTSFLFLLLLSHINANAQVNAFEKAYLVQDNDTIQGYIKSASDLDLSKSIQFKTNLSSEAVTTYHPEDISAFSFQSSGIYFATVKAEIIKGSSVQQVSRFAKLLSSGYTNLYKLQLPEEEQSIVTLKSNTFIYVLQKDTVYYTLALYETMNGVYAIKNKRYAGMLRAVFNDCDNLGINLDRLIFNDKAIITAVTRYNACKNPALQTTQHNYKTKAVVKHGVEIYLSQLYVPNNVNGISAQGYSAGYFWDIIQPDVSRRASTKIGLSYMYYTLNYKSPNQEYTNAVSHFVRLPFSGQYSLTDPLTSKTIPFISVGFTAQVSSGFSSAEFIPLPSIGVGMYSKRIRYSVLLENDGFGISNPKIINFSLGLRLDK